MQNLEEKTALGFSSNLGAMICYLGNFVCSFGFIYSIIVIVTDKTNKFVRFHAWQSLLISLAGGVLGIIGAVVAIIGGAIDAFIGFPIFTILIGIILLIVGLTLLGMLVLAGIRANRGELYKVPVIGNYAEKFA